MLTGLTPRTIKKSQSTDSNSNLGAGLKPQENTAGEQASPIPIISALLLNTDFTEQKKEYVLEKDGIGYEVSEPDFIYAYLISVDTEGEDEKIGELQMEDDWLHSISVDEEQQRNGVGSTMIKLAIDYLGLGRIGCVQESSASRYSLTSGGENLIASCIRKGIVTEAMCKFDGDDTDLYEQGGEGDEDGEYSNDHQLYNSLVVRTALDGLKAKNYESADEISASAARHDAAAEYDRARLAAKKRALAESSAAATSAASVSSTTQFPFFGSLESRTGIFMFQPQVGAGVQPVAAVAPEAGQGSNEELLNLDYGMEPPSP